MLTVTLMNYDTEGRISHLRNVRITMGYQGNDNRGLLQMPCASISLMEIMSTVNEFTKCEIVCSRISRFR